MTVFLIVAALLLAIALGALLLPLLRKTPAAGTAESSALSLQVLREQLAELDNEQRAGTLDAAQYATERSEIERRAIEDGQAVPQHVAPSKRPVWLAAAIAITVSALAIGVYLKLGTPEALDEQAANQGGQQQNAHAVTPQQIQAMVTKLAERLQSAPDDGDGWLMLARSYSALGRYPEAATAFGRAMKILPADAQLLADYADIVAMAQNRRLQGEPEQIIKRALAADPRNVKALALSGSLAFERQNYAGAIGEWRKALAVVPPDSNIAERIRDGIADAEARSGKKPAGSGNDGGTAAPAAAKTIRGVVSLDSALRSRAADSDTVFVFARAANGPRMPLAIKRMTVKDLPARFALDDSMGMPGGPKLSSQGQVVIGARVSKSGSATPQPGDLEGHSETVPLGSDNVRLTISTVQ
jgi:cytochrome c-type biogenesis protein CcmH